jgi:TusA-related sulfurtransferase
MLLIEIFRPIGLAWLGVRHRLTRSNRLKLKQVELPKHGTLLVDDSLCFIGDSCLRTNLLTKLVLDKAIPGSLYEISSDNLSAVETIPFMLPNCNCEHIATIQEPSCIKIYVRKREAIPGPFERIK